MYGENIRVDWAELAPVSRKCFGFGACLSSSLLINTRSSECGPSRSEGGNAHAMFFFHAWISFSIRESSLDAFETRLKLVVRGVPGSPPKSSYGSVQY